MEFFTDVPAGCVGIGGSPGEAVWVKAGLTAEEPTSAAVEGVHGHDAYYRMNVDKGVQAADGADARVLGTIGYPDGDCLERTWTRRVLSSNDALEFTSDESGGAWILIGTDSGFEGRTELYYTRLVVGLDAAG